MTYETPRDADGAKACAWCGGAIRQAGVGRSRDYCGRTCREYAYRERRTQKRIAEALEAAAAASASVSSTDDAAIPSTDGTESAPVSSTDEMAEPQARPEIPTPAAPAPAPAAPRRPMRPTELPRMPKLWR